VEVRCARGVRLHAAECLAGAQAGRHELRGGCGGLRRGDPGPGVPETGGSAEGGKTILIYGASGSIGTAAVQLARYFGADVSAVWNTKNVETVRSLGAGQVIDYTREDFTKNGQTCDVIFDVVGKCSFWRCKSSLQRGGFHLATDLWQNLVLAVWTARLGAKKVVFPITPRYTKKDVLFLKQLIEAGKYRAVDGRGRRMGQACAVRGAFPDLPRRIRGRGAIEIRQLFELERSDASN
jgi:NADPH:quinone reductase-like Zn-dependent oxidoreductase